MRNELEIHLSPLKRQGLIETWHDRRILAGDEWDKEIDRNLETADIILLLISPYFIASNYCYEIEMIRALERHDKGEVKVIPIILEPCDWQDMLFGKLQAVPRDNRPISKFPNLHDGFLEVIHEIKLALNVLGINSPGQPQPILNKATKQSSAKSNIRSSNLRIKKTFSDQDYDDFLDDTFEYIANFFDGSLTELSARNPEIETRCKRIDANNFTAFIYKNGKTSNQCRIWMGGLGSSFSSQETICYSSNVSPRNNGFNESVSVVDDGQTMLLRMLGISMHSQNRDQTLTQQGAAEYFWGLLIRPLQQ